MSQYSYSQNATPIAAITNLAGTEIISCSQPLASINGWAIQKAKAVITRFWSAATCEFTLTVPKFDNFSVLKPLPKFYKIEREFCLWLGYFAQSEYAYITPDLLGKNLKRVYVGVIETIARVGSDQGGYSVSISSRDRMKWLMDTTVTFNPYRKDETLKANVSNIGEGSEKGVPRSQIILEVARRGIGQTDLEQCLHCGKDILKSSTYYYDKALSSGDMPEPDSWYLSADTAQTSAQTIKQLTDKLGAVKGELTKAAALLLKAETDYNKAKQITTAGLDRLKNQFENSKTKHDEVLKSYNDINGQLYKIQEQDQINKLQASKQQGKLTGPLGGNPLSSLAVQENPEFRIFCTRPPINLQEKGDFLVDDKRPAELIKFFAMQEIYPTELFQDSRDGNFYYAPRMADTSGLSDSNRFYRSYYFGIPREILSPLHSPLNINQFLLRYKEEETSIGLKTNFVVKGSNVYSKNSTSAFNVHLRTKPYALKEENFACKFAYYNDETIQSLEEAVIVAFNIAKLYGRETRAAIGVLLGDPSIVPGEICQVAASWTVDRYDNLPQYLADDKKAFEGSQSVLSKAKQLVKDFDKKLDDPQDKEFEVDLPLGEKLKGKALDQKDDQLEDPETIICKDTSKVYSDNKVGFNHEPRTIWRVEAIIHDFGSTDKGYKTEVAWSSPL